MTTTNFKLEDLVPESGSFHLSKLDQTLTVNPVTIEDWQWLKTKYGEKLDDVLKGKDWEAICNIVFRLLPENEKALFAAKDCVYWNEETGEKFTGRIGGGKLLQHNINGIPEFLKVLEALYRAIGAGKPLAEAKEIDSKKKD